MGIKSVKAAYKWFNLIFRLSRWIYRCAESALIISEYFEPPNRILRATIPENESRSKLMILFSQITYRSNACKGG